MNDLSAPTPHPLASSRRPEEVIALEQQVSANNYHPIDVVLQSGRGEWLYDTDGRRYLDMMSAYSAVSHGHSHPRLVAVLAEQAGQLAITSRAFRTRLLGPFLERIVALTGLDKALPANGGVESVEAAIKAARRWGYRVRGIAADQANIVVARGNFHGRTTAVVGFSSEQDYRADFGPFAPGFRFFDFGDIASLRAAIDDNTCAVLMEPIQGEAGIRVPPVGFLRAARALCTERRVLLILDEIQSGLGRTGRWFAHQHEGIRPDGLILGKALGGGLLPVSCFVATREVMDLFDPGSHGSTFGGNPLAAAVGLKALEVLEDEGLIARSAALGQHLLDRLEQLRQQQQLPLIRAVRGRGLWAGVDLDPAFVRARLIVDRMVARGILSKDTHETVIRFAPPLVISRAALDWAIDTFAEVLQEYAAEFAAGLAAAGRPLPGVTREAAPVPVPGEVAPTVASGPRLMMCAPDHFEVSYRINPWMDPRAWEPAAAQLRADAQRGWTALRDYYAGLGAAIELEAPQAGLPDMVFTANAALVLDRTVLLARFRNAERTGEETHNRAFFERLQARGLVERILETPPGMAFEGAGDAAWDASRGLIWTGWGQRSDRAASGLLEQTFGVPTVALELVDPRFYHLDTCLCVLSGGEILVYPPAFSGASYAQLEELAGPAQLIRAGEEDALHLAVNGVCIGRDVVLCHASDALRGALASRGYRVHVVGLDSFNRSGGAACCLTLRLDASTLRG